MNVSNMTYKGGANMDQKSVSFYQCVSIKIRKVAPGQKEFTDVAVVVTKGFVLVCTNPNALINLFCKPNEDFRTWLQNRDIKLCIEYIKNILVNYGQNSKRITDYDLKCFLRTHTQKFPGNVMYTLYDTKRLDSLTL